MNPSKVDIQKWVDALRSGTYAQTQCTLQDNSGFCCLGVACDIFIAAENLKLDDSGYMWGGLPGAQPKAPAWLKNIHSDFRKKTGLDFSQLNDGGLGNFDTDIAEIYLKSFTFDEIADIIEAIYIHEVLGA